MAPSTLMEHMPMHDMIKSIHAALRVLNPRIGQLDESRPHRPAEPQPEACDNCDIRPDNRDTFPDQAT